MKKRIAGFLCFFIVLLGIVVLRIAEISVGKEAEEAATFQSRRKIELSETRAGIFDRNFLPLVNKNNVRKILVFPDLLDVSKIAPFVDRDTMAEIFQKSDPSAIDIGGKIIDGKVFIIFHIRKDMMKNVLRCT